jgi:hypothetical protein
MNRDLDAMEEIEGHDDYVPEIERIWTTRGVGSNGGATT